MISKHAQAYVRQRNKKLEEELELKAGKDDIISTINLSSEGVAIQGNKIDLTGAVSVNDNVTIDEEGKLTAISATISGGTINLESNDGTSKFYLYSDGFYDGSTGEEQFSEFTINSHGTDWQGGKKETREVTQRASMYNTQLSFVDARPTEGSYVGTYDVGGFQLDAPVSGTTTTTIKGYARTGNITCVSLTQTSDRNAKEDIKEIPEENAVRFIKSLRPVEFKFKGMDGKHHGFIAQEVVADWDLVSEGEMKSLAYNEIIADLVATVQNLTKRVEVLEEKING